MKAIKILIDEHDLIIQCLDHLSLAAKKIVDNQGPPKEFFEGALDFCRVYADKYHHWKEEYVMFSQLAQKHGGTLDNEIERHRSQHEQCRNLIQNVAESLEGYSMQLNENTRRVHRNVSDYVHTLRSHIKSENEIFFPMVEQTLTDEEDKSLINEFEKYGNRTGSDIPSIYKKRISELADML